MSPHASIKIIGVFMFALLAGCAGALKKPIPLAVVTPPPLEQSQIRKRVLLVVDRELKNASFSSSQLATTWTYPLGEVLPGIFERALSESFQEVAVASDDSTRSSFDIVVRPKIVRFEAIPPATVFSRTSTSATLAYDVLDVATGGARVLSASGTQTLVTERDKLILEKIAKRMPTLFTGTYTGGWLITVPEYTSLAARDAMVAILHCVDDLNRQLRVTVRER